MSSLKLSSGHTLSTPNGRPSDDRLGYLRDLSNRINKSLQLSSYNREDATSIKRTKHVVRRLFVENEPLPISEPSIVSDSSSHSTSIHLCSCLNPQVAHKVHEFQRRFADVSSSVDRIRHDSINTHEHIRQSIHPSGLNAFPPSISSHSNAQSPSQNDSVRDDPPPMHLNSTCSLPNTAFHRWLALTRKMLSLRQRSAYLDKLFRLRRLKKTFEKWRETYIKILTLRSLETDYRDQISIHITRSCFYMWQEKTGRGIHQVEADDRIRCLRNALTQWKMHHQQVMEEDGNVRTHNINVQVHITSPVAIYFFVVMR